MTIAIADTSALFAYYDRGSPEHSACRKSVAECSHLVVTPLVLAELDYMITTRVGDTAARAALAHIRDRCAVRRYAVPEVEPHLTTVLAVMNRYPGVGLTDAMNLVVAAEYTTATICTLDRRHFRMMRPLTGHPAFTLLPDDA